MSASDASRKQPDAEVAMLAALSDEHVELHKDVIEIDAETWAIHVRIAYEGEVIAVTFSSERSAWAALSRLADRDRD
jgi:hypothetical protein